MLASQFSKNWKPVCQLLQKQKETSQPDLRDVAFHKGSSYIADLVVVGYRP